MSELKEKIKNTNDIVSEVITVKQWDCKIEVRTIMAKDRAKILNDVMDDNGKINNENFHILMIIDSCYDPDTGEKLFDKNDAGWLAEKSSAAIEKLSAAVMKLSGLSKESIGEAEKN